MQYGNLFLFRLPNYFFCCLNRTMQYGNFFLRVRDFGYIYRLNRTMQYGNPLPCLRKFSDLRRLNRTMQYGNLFRTLFLFENFEGFKSYYVVWKHTTSEVFRSQTFPFKSYYVVWKPSKRTQHFGYRHCLNRTMQYGNWANGKHTVSKNNV